MMGDGMSFQVVTSKTYWKRNHSAIGAFPYVQDG